jgi:hypothetical protein
MNSPFVAASSPNATPAVPRLSTLQEEVVVDGIPTQGSFVAACVFPDESCENLTEEECFDKGGQWHPNMDCAMLPAKPKEFPKSMPGQLVQAVVNRATALAMKLAGIGPRGKPCGSARGEDSPAAPATRARQ